MILLWLNTTFLIFKSSIFPVNLYAGMISEAQKDILTKFGAHLESLRKKQKLSLRKLALRCDVEYADIKRYENGEINPTLITVTELAKGLGILVKELMDY